MAQSGNQLRDATSPYLLQHADNPVHWRPWGAASLAEARAADKPILLSIGYAACHWCHVMAHESFEDPATAALMNELFVAIKVDREERPDIDHLYMSALHALGEQGGWPLTMFLTPDGAPFWGGTYFPPEARWGWPSFRQVLTGVSEAFRTNQEAVTKNTDALCRALASMSASRPGDRIEASLLDRLGGSLLSATDPIQGGLRGAPKFPNPPIFRFLWQEGCRTMDPAYQDAVHNLLAHTSQGGIYDHLGGGYARYSTDAVWLVPHFEKMLYDNAQLLELLALAHAGRPAPLYAARAAETVAWLLRDMRIEAAFASSEDADSEGEEGRFYIWREAEIDRLLGPAGPAFKAAYDVTTAGNWEGVTILRRLTDVGAHASAEQALSDCRAILFQARSARVRPGRDDKILVDWNALTIAALCRAAAVFAQPAWLDVAVQAYRFLRALAAEDGRVPHGWRLGRVTATGLLEDQAAMARAALALFEASGEADYLIDAVRFADAAHAWFADTDGSCFTTASDATDIPLGAAARPRTAGDNATPSGNGLIAEVCARLFHLTGDRLWAERADAVIRAFSGNPEALAASSTLLAAADLLERGACVVIAGPDDDRTTADLLATALRAPDPAVCVLRARSAAPVPPGHPAQGKTTDSGAAFVCRAQRCSLPVVSAGALVELLTMPMA